MQSRYNVKLKTVVEEMGLTPLVLSSDYEKALITTADVNRPAMQLTGFYNYFDPKRIQIIGRVEHEYLSTLSPSERFHAFNIFMGYDIAALVLCHEIEPFPECLEAARLHNRNVFYTDTDTSDFQASLIIRLHDHLAPQIQMHGVLVEIYGEGMLLTGESGIGKSETALELIKRGHRLVADDLVEIRRVSSKTLVGTAPEIIRHLIEIRGVGFVDVNRLYGVGAVKLTENIQLVIQLEKWVEGKEYERVGLDEQYFEILGIKVPSVTIPVMPGRNLAVIVEAATMNNRQKKMGYNAAAELNKRVFEKGADNESNS